MLLIDLPCCSNVIAIMCDDNYMCIQNELYNAYYPYGKLIKKDEIPIDSLKIFVESGMLFIYHPRICPQRMQFNGLYDAYKKLINIIRDHLCLKTGWCLLHGCAIDVHGQVVILLGRSGAGKTTFGVFMDTVEECSCLSDDLIILNFDTLRIYPISRTAHLRQEAIMYVDAKHTYNPFLHRYEYEYLGNRFQNEYYLHSLFFLHRNDLISRVEKKSNVHMSLLENMYLPYQISANMTSALRISEKIPGFDLYYSNLNDAYNAIICIGK